MDMFSYLLGRSSGGGGKGGLKVLVVEELPETGEANTLYLVPRQVSKYRNVFDEYLWINETWEMVGTTDIDISGKQDKMQFDTMPTASVDNVGKIYQYTGTTNVNYTNGYFYICLSDGGDPATYSWVNIDVENKKIYFVDINSGTYSSQANIAVIKQIFSDISNGKNIYVVGYNKSKATTAEYYPCQFNRNSNSLYLNFNRISYSSGNWDAYGYQIEFNNTNNYIYETVNSQKQFMPFDNTSAYTPSGDYNPATKKYVDDSIIKIQYDTMPTADETNLGKIVQYIGATTQDYTNGYFYQVVSDGEATPTYSWENINVQEASGGGGDDGVVITSSNRYDPSIIEAVDNAYQKWINNEPYKVYVYVTNSGYPHLLPVYFRGVNYTVGVRLFSAHYIFHGSNMSSATMGGMGYAEVTISNGHITEISSPNYYNYSIGATTNINSDFIMMSGNTKSYTPSGNYNPATKKYVDDKPTTYTGYDATKTQVLKNIQGTLTWVDEE